MFWLPSAFSKDCNVPGDDIPDSVVQRYDCELPSEENPLASLLFATEGETLRFFLQRISSQQAFNIGVSICFFSIWLIFCATQYGIAVPAGLFFPGLLIGGSLGQFVALTFNKIGILDTEHMLTEMPTYAVIGGVAVLSGYTRLSFCLAVLLMETT